jgi:hypothetical protein
LKERTRLQLTLRRLHTIYRTAQEFWYLQMESSDLSPFRLRSAHCLGLHMIYSLAHFSSRKYRPPRNAHCHQQAKPRCPACRRPETLCQQHTAHAREIFSKVSTIPKRSLSSADTATLPGLSTTKDFMPAAIAASTSLTLSLRNRTSAGAS